MAFSSASSKKKATDTVNKLFESILPGTCILPQTSQLSATESFYKEASKRKLLPEEIKKLNKAQKAKQNKQVNKKVLKDKKFQKLMKYNLIKSHKDRNELTEGERKFLKKLVKKNSSAIRRAGDVDDILIKEEIDELRDEILLLENEKYDRSSKRKQDNRLQEFKQTTTSGEISYSGLTPGLAPVGLDDESDEE